MNSGKQGYIRWGTEQGKHFEIATFLILNKDRQERKIQMNTKANRSELLQKV